jgi:hypothetical protein
MADSRKDDIPALCSMVGFVTIYWALIERQMDNIFFLIHANYGGVPKYRDRPVQFKRKVAYLRKAARDNKHIRHLAGEILRLLPVCEKAANTRHLLVHGCIESLQGGELVLNKVQYTDDFSAEEVRFDVGNEFPELASSLERMAREWLMLCELALEAHRTRASG